MRLLLQLLGWCQCCRCYFRRSVLMHQWRRLSMAIAIQINRHRIYKGYHKMIKHEPALFRIQQSVEAEKMMQTQEQTRSSRSKQPRATRFCSCISRRTSPPQKHVLRTRMLLDATYSHMLPISFLEWCFGLSISCSVCQFSRIEDGEAGKDPAFKLQWICSKRLHQHDSNDPVACCRK